MEEIQSTQPIEGVQPEMETLPVAGQAEVTQPVQDAGQAPAPEVQDSFFDPSKLPDELKNVYKQMQSAYTKKTQAIAEQRRKVEAYDQFARDPISAMQQLAREMGYTLTRAQAQEAVQAQQTQQQQAEWQPQTWQEVEQRIKQAARQEILQEISPYIQGMQQFQRDITASQVERTLNDLDSNWRMYEDEIRETMKAHPTLVKDVTKLYKLSVPEEVYTSRAVQEALKKMQSKVNQAQVAGKSTTSRSTPAPKGKPTFQEAVEIAKQELASQGR